MIVYLLQKIWKNNGWSIIFVGVVLSLLYLFFFYKNRQGTTSIQPQNIFEKLFEPVIQRLQSATEPSTPSPPEPKSNSNESQGEKTCRDFLEYVFKKKFEKVRPSFLLNPITNQPLELDCYNEELKLAVEYNGKQHYEYNKMMHQHSKHSFQNQQYRDLIKSNLCKENNITLIIVPYNVPVPKIPEYLYHQLKNHGFLNNPVSIYN